MFTTPVRAPVRRAFTAMLTMSAAGALSGLGSGVASAATRPAVPVTPTSNEREAPGAGLVGGLTHYAGQCGEGVVEESQIVLANLHYT